MTAEYPRFSSSEMQRRRSALETVIAHREIDGVLIYGSNRTGSAVQWISEWPVTREAALVLTPGSTDSMFVQFYNHLPAARRFADQTNVSWGGSNTMASVSAGLKSRGVKRLGIIGPLGWRAHAQLADSFDTFSLDADYTRLRLVKSAEELAWLREGARLSDLAAEAVRDGLEPGMAERELGALCEIAYLATGATNHIHYFAVTAMDSPDRCVPSQWPSDRRVSVGDVVTFEISASWWGHSGQVLRSMTVGADPTNLYVDLHSTADAAYDAICAVLKNGANPNEVITAASVIEDAGFTIYDDLVHGYGGGYFPPILGSASRMNEPLPDMVFETGMTVVVQPNVITPDELAGVQTGGLVAITDNGVEHLQMAPRGFWRVH